MFCTQCGLEIPDGNQFCTRCGMKVASGGSKPPVQGAQPEPVPGSMPVATSTPAPAPKPVFIPAHAADAPQQASATRSKAPLFAAFAVAVAIIAAAAGFSLGMFGSQGNSVDVGEDAASTSVEASASEESEDAEEAEEAEEAEAAEPEEDADEGDSEQAIEEPESSSARTAEDAKPVVEAPVASKALDLSDPSIYAQVNTFLSNFSEVEFGDMPDVSAATSEDLAVFAVKHVGRNSFSEWESAPADNRGWGLPRDDKWSGGVDGLRGWRLSADRVQDLVSRYFGRTVDFSDITFDRHPGWVVYQDGYVYFGTTNGASWPGGIALATSAVDQADGTISVEFEIYNNFGYDATDQSLYSCTPAQIMDRLGVEGPIQTGTATVRMGDYNEYTGGLLLVSYRTETVNR